MIAASPKWLKGGAVRHLLTPYEKGPARSGPDTVGVVVPLPIHHPVPT